jgi:HSP20 family protein
MHPVGTSQDSSGVQEDVMLTKDFLPMKRLEDYFGRMDRLFGNERQFPLAWPRDLGMKVEWMPTADIIETDKEYLVQAELPEVPKEDIHVDIEDGVLRLHGERKYEKKDKSEKMQRMERFYGEFERTFMIPEDVDVAKIKLPADGAATGARAAWRPFLRPDPLPAGPLSALQPAFQ